MPCMGLIQEFPKPYSYLIFKRGNITYAKPGNTNLPWHYNIDPSIVIMAAVYSLPPTGGIVLIKEDVYNCLTPIVLIDCYYFILRGSGRGGYQPQRLGQTVLNKMFNGDLITISYSIHESQNSFGLENFVCWSDYNTYTGDGIVISGDPAWFWIDNVRISRMENTGLSITDAHAHRLQNVIVTEVKNGHGIFYDTCFDWQWEYVEVDTNAQPPNFAAVRLDNSHGMINGGHFEGWRCLDIRKGAGSSNIHIVNAWIPWAREQAIHVEDTNIFSISNSVICNANANNDYAGVNAATIYLNSTDCLISNCYISDYATNEVHSIYADAAGLHLSNCHLPIVLTLADCCNHITNCKLAGGIAITNAANIIKGCKIATGINVNGNDNHLIDNTFMVAPAFAGLRNIIEYNTGYITENHGLATMANGTAAIPVAHGLAATPNCIHVTGTTNDTKELWITTVGAANFTINAPANVGGNRIIHWHAQYYP